MVKQKALKGLRDFMRELVFGMEDGLVSNLGIIFAVFVATKSQSTILLAGLASMFAGALSMAAGSYLSSKSVKELYQFEVKKAKELIKKKPKQASKEMKKILRKEKFDQDEIDIMMKHFIKHNHRTFAINYIQKKLHLNPETGTNPVHDALVMFIAFTLGSLFPIIPFFFGSSMAIMSISAVLTIVTLFAVGVTKASVSHRDWVRSGFEMVVIGMGAGLIGYLVGFVFGIVV